MSDLETKVELDAFTSMTEDEYVEKFYDRYESDIAFRALVDKKTELPTYQQRIYGLVQSAPVQMLRILPGARQAIDAVYENLRETKIKDHALKQREYLIQRKKLIELAQAEERVLKRKRELEAMRKRADATLDEKLARMRAERELTEDEISRLRSEEAAIAAGYEGEADAAKRQIVMDTDVRERRREIAREFALNTGLLEMDSSGRVSFSKDIMNALEDLYLNNFTVKGGMGSSGKFVSDLRIMFEEGEEADRRLVDIDHPADMRDIIWEDSLEESLRMGYQTVVYPYAFLEEVTYQALAKLGFHTATTIDVSGSMDGVAWQVAKETGLAVSGLMRKLSPKNSNYLSVFSHNVTEITTQQLYSEVRTGGRTNMSAALNWCVNKLEPLKAPGLINLITDGAPDSLNKTVNQAARISDNPFLQLNIYLIGDHHRETIDNVSQIGRASGPDAKFIPLPTDKVDSLGSVVIKGIANSIQRMYDNKEFARFLSVA